MICWTVVFQLRASLAWFRPRQDRSNGKFDMLTTQRYTLNYETLGPPVIITTAVVGAV